MYIYIFSTWIRYNCAKTKNFIFQKDQASFQTLLSKKQNILQWN